MIRGFIQTASLSSVPWLVLCYQPNWSAFLQTPCYDELQALVIACLAYCIALIASLPPKPLLMIHDDMLCSVTWKCRLHPYSSHSTGSLQLKLFNLFTRLQSNLNGLLDGFACILKATVSRPQSCTKSAHFTQCICFIGQLGLKQNIKVSF